ncbi:MAG: tRNA pseudouridine(38-40) synthase TruA [Clostridia bacterium]|nr:tRNA pseudouridine(38-40) synthase TruA [Clostridia bacterium]
MRNTALLLSYEGTAYHGWQIQKDEPTVQQTLSEAIKKLTGSWPSPELTGCGRTDAGVHALNYVANFHHDSTVPAERMPYALLPFLPPDISVKAAREVPDDFNARFSCIKKEYCYRIYSAPFPDPFKRDRACFTTYPLDVERMNAAARLVEGRHDFAAFRATGGSAKTSVRTVFSCRVEQEEDQTAVYISADGFLYNMVRIIAGTLLYVSAGKIEPESITDIIEGRQRTSAGITMPPQGLYLRRVWYGEREGLDF